MPFTALLHLLLLHVSSVILGAGPDLSYQSKIWGPSHFIDVEKLFSGDSDYHKKFTPLRVRKSVLSLHLSIETDSDLNLLNDLYKFRLDYEKFLLKLEDLRRQG